MTPEELLKPRYKVIADMPFKPTPSMYSVGDIITDNGGNSALTDQNGDYVFDLQYSKYPHLFKKLEWWEERDEKDLSEYVKLINGKICKVTQYFNFNTIEIIMDGETRNCRLKNSLPATEEEYNTQNK